MRSYPYALCLKAFGEPSQPYTQNQGEGELKQEWMFPQLREGFEERLELI
jgi:hypothetical protein